MNELALSTWITNHGISYGTLEMILLIPVLATIVSIARYGIGLKTFGIYAPIILAVAYRFTGLRYGLIITAITVLTTIISYKTLRKIRMHYITRIAINYTILAIILVGSIIVLDQIEVLGLTNFEGVHPLGFVSIAALSDYFIKQYVKKRIRTTMRTIIETTLVSIIGWYAMTSHSINLYIVNNFLWILPVLVLINVALGQFKGFKLKDYIRFKTISENE
jgi:hypothetical protein